MSGEETVRERLNRIRQQLNRQTNVPPNFVEGNGNSYIPPQNVQQPQPGGFRATHNQHQAYYGPNPPYTNGYQPMPQPPNSLMGTDLTFSLMQQQLMQQANQQNNNFLRQRIEAEKRKSRELLKRMQEIKSLRHKRIIEEEQNAALLLAETFASNISKGKEKLEIERKLQLEER